MALHRRFKMALYVPLVTVELSFSGAFELTAADADILVQVRGKSVLRLKEWLPEYRSWKVPKAVEFVAWLDCDIILERQSWSEETIRLLDEYPLLGSYSLSFTILYLKLLGSFLIRGRLSQLDYQLLILSPPVMKPLTTFAPVTSKCMRRCAFGLAWSVKRDLLDPGGFYDALILGSGRQGVGVRCILHDVRRCDMRNPHERMASRTLSRLGQSSFTGK